jgi:predicted nucleic acid-binding protein
VETVVIDANLAVGLLVERPWSALAEQKMLEWKSRKFHLVVPALWPGEVMSALRKAIYLHQLDQEDALKLVSAMSTWNIQVYVPDAALNRSSLVWAERLGQMVAYDAQYLALAEHLNAVFYTADRKLFNRCQQIGAQFVKLLE